MSKSEAVVDQVNGVVKARPRPLPHGYTKHHIIFLEAIHLPLPPLDFDYDITAYPHTPPELIAERIRPGTIVISAVANVRPQDLAQAPNVQMMLVLATGMAWVDKPWCAEHGVSVLNCPQSNIDAVTEHFLALYLSSRKRVPIIDHLVKTSDEWAKTASLTKKVWPRGPPLGIRQETLGIIGYGSLGRNIEAQMKALGVKKVLVAERRGAQTIRPGRIAFEEMLQQATTICIVCPREPDTINLIDEDEFAMMREDALLVNIARGGIVNEGALARALRQGKIFGAATDVFDEEPSGPGLSPLLPDTARGEDPVPNLIVSSHIAWFSGRTIETLQGLAKLALEKFATGHMYDEDVRKSVVVHDGSVWR